MSDRSHHPHPQAHDTTFATPVKLMLDTRLTPVERNGWQVLRMLRAADGISPLASLGQLRRYLTSTPLGQQAGLETGRRALTVLRLTGWISLVGQSSDPMTGHVFSEQYRVHEQALTFEQACALDASLPQLLRESIDHDNNLVDRVAVHIQETLEAKSQSSAVDASTPHDDDDEPPLSGPPAGERTDEAVSAEPAHHPDGMPQTGEDRDRPHDASRTYSTYKYLNNKKERTYRAGAHAHARESDEAVSPPMALPPCLRTAAVDQQKDVQTALRRLPPPQRQDVLDELQARSQHGTQRRGVLLRLDQARAGR